jgi:hypothetical protein
LNLLQKIAIGGGIGAIIIVLFFALYNNEIPEPKSIDPEAIEMLREYRGIDGQGKSMRDVLGEKFDEDYPDISVLNDSPGKIEWYAYEENFQGKTLTRVGYVIQTFKEDNEYYWYLDKNSLIIIAGNDLGQQLLDRLD